MKEIRKQAVYTEPELQIVHLTETDIITTSGGFRDDEGEIIGFDSLGR